ncbi:hypothetical protein HK100_009823, partial [Physocladia obscura]
MSSLLLCLGITYLRYDVVILRSKKKKPQIKNFARNYPIACVVFLATLVSTPFIFGSAPETYILRSSHVYCAAAWYAQRGFTAVCIMTVFAPVCFIGYAYTAIFLRVRELNADVKSALGTGDQDLSQSPTDKLLSQQPNNRLKIVNTTNSTPIIENIAAFKEIPMAQNRLD